MKNLIKIILGILLCHTMLLSQSGINAPSGSSNINQNTGKSVYTVPLHSINELGLNLPISIQNNMGGLRVEDVGGEIGSGWNSNFIPTITRQVRGASTDERMSHDNFFIDNIPLFHQHYTYGYFEAPLNDECENVAPENCLVDYVPDLFYYNIYGYSGSFFIKLNDDFSLEVIQMSPSDILIQFNIQNNYEDIAIGGHNVNPNSNIQRHIIGWKVTLPNGNIISFGDFDADSFSKEYTEYTMFHRQRKFGNETFSYNVEYSSKWFAKSLENQNNTLTFNYEDELYELKQEQNSFIVFNKPEDISEEYSYNSENERYFFTKRIKTIYSKYQSINFSYDLPRNNVLSILHEDFTDQKPKLLDYITVNLNNGNCLSKIKFNYLYDEQNVNGYISKYFLKSISNGSCDDKILNTSSFTYNNENKAQQTAIYARDYWGYYNGEDKNESLLSIPQINASCYVFIHSEENEVNREPNEEFLKYGTLEKIEYSNGMVERYDYEINDFPAVSYDFENILTVTKYVQNGYECGNITSSIDLTPALNTEYQILLDQVNSSCQQHPIYSPYLKIKVFKDGQLHSQNSINKSLMSWHEIETELNLNRLETFNLQFEIVYNSEFDIEGAYNISLNEIPIINSNQKASGLRLKSHTINDITTNYEYVLENNINPTLEHYTAEFCEACTTKDDGIETCLSWNDEIKNIYFGCETKVDLAVISNFRGCSEELKGETRIDFVSKYEEFSFAIIVPTQQAQSDYELEDLINHGLIPGQVYDIIISTNATDNSSLYCTLNLKIFDDLPPSNELLSSGQLLNSPYNIGIFNYPGIDNTNGECDDELKYYLNTNSQSLFNSNLNAEVVYSRIKSYQDLDNGYTISNFNIKTDNINNYRITNSLNPLIPVYTEVNTISNSFLKDDFSLPISIEMYDSDDKLVHIVNNEFIYKENVINFPILYKYNNCDPLVPGYLRKFSSFNVFTSNINLQSKLTKVDNVSTTYEYLYNDNDLLKETTFFNTNFSDQKRTSSTVYSNELSEYNWLTQLNYILPIETLVDEGLGGGTKYEYALIDGKVRLIKEYSLDNDQDEESKWIVIKENLSWNDDGQATEIWSKVDSKNTILNYESGLLKSSSYGVRETTYVYDDYRRLERTTNSLGISTFIEEYDVFHRKKNIHYGVLGDEETGLSKTEYDYIISQQEDERIITKKTFSSGDYNIPEQNLISSFDIYGRGYKEEQLNFTHDGNNFITYSNYDELGRLETNINPSSGLSASLHIYEASPLNRVLEYKPHGTSNRILYAYGNQVSNIDGYPTSYFIKSSVIDENGNETKSYSSIDGKLEIIVDALDYKTEYRYNDRNQLLSVTSPDGSLYEYIYDGFGRLVQKIIPKKGTYTYLYNQYEQIDLEILPNGETLNYNYNKDYNSFLESVTNFDQEVLQRYEPYHENLITDLVGDEYIKVLGENKELHHKYVYDEYGRLEEENREFYEGSSTYNYIYDNSGNVRNVTRVHTQEDGTSLNYSTTYTYDKGIRLEEITGTFHGVTDELLINRMKYADNDWLMYKNQGDLHAEVYSYNSRGWLNSINSVENTYDVPLPNCNQIHSDKCISIGEIPSIEEDIYEENQPANNLFAIEFHRDQNFSLNAPAQRNGTISWMEWRVKGEDSQQYGFTYDNIYRLREAKYKAEDKPTCINKNVGAYDVSIGEYDEVGNIGFIKRNGLVNEDLDNPEYGEIDDIILSYVNGSLEKIKEEGNLIKGYKSADGSTKTGTVVYENGNVVYDPIRDLNEVEYNFLDLPTKVTTTKGIIEFTYDALGNQLKVNKNKDGVTLAILYADGIEYENNILKSYAFEEGRVVYNESLQGVSSTTYVEWAITDHLGNVRLRYVDKNKDGNILVDLSNSSTNEITGSYHYYPFGQLMEGQWNRQQGNKNRYQYNDE